MTAIESKPTVVPVPERLTVCGLVLVLSVMVRVPVKLATVFGMNVTETEQLAPAPRVLGDNGQVEVCPKFWDVEIPVMVSGVV